MLLLSIFGLALFYVPQAWVHNPLQLGVLQMASGFLMAGVLASVAALLANLVPEGRHGAVYGVNTTIVAVANALAPTAGAGLAIWLGLSPLFYVAAGFFAVGGVMTWLFMPRPAEAPTAAKKLRVSH
jgi:MFS family permease